MTGTVVGTTDVELGNRGSISFRLKRSDDLLYAVMVVKAGVTLYYPVDLSDLRHIEAALRVTRQQLDPSRRDELARQKEIDIRRLNIFEKIWRWVSDTPLWKEDVVFRNRSKTSFRIRRKQDERSEIVFRSGEVITHLRAEPRELKLLEDAAIATRTAIEDSKNQNYP